MGMAIFLFTSVAIGLIANIHNGQQEAKATVDRIGVEEKDYTDPVAVARALRSAVVDEWLGENSEASPLWILQHMLRNTGVVVSFAVI